MSRPRLVHVASLDELRAAAPRWDDLWLRSPVTMPSARAELAAQWVEQFARPGNFHALVVEDGRRWVAALPLVRRRVGRIITAGDIPNNEWSSNGDLLLDPDAEVDEAMDLLVEAIARLRWQLLWMDEVVLDAPRWGALLGALERAAMAAYSHRRFRVARVPTDGDWQARKSLWSRKHRQKMAWCARQLARRGEVRLEIHSRLAAEEVRSLMRRGFEVEDRSWKGKAGTSVLRTPGMFDFFVRQGEQLARWGQLELCFLNCQDRPVAFTYGFSGKGVFHSVKVGYDPEYAACAPGQLMRYYMLERFHEDKERLAVDLMGPISDAHAKWKPQSYTIGRLAVAPRRRLGRMVLGAYKHCWPCVRRLRELANARQRGRIVG